MEKGRVETAQQFQHDDGQELMNWSRYIRLTAVLTSLDKTTYCPKPPPRCNVSSGNIPSKLNVIHGHFMNTHGVNYDQVVTPLGLLEERGRRKMIIPQEQLPQPSVSQPPDRCGAMQVKHHSLTSSMLTNSEEDIDVFRSVAKVLATEVKKAVESDIRVATLETMNVSLESEVKSLKKRPSHQQQVYTGNFDTRTEHELPDPPCPYPPVDVSRVTVHKIRQPEDQRVPCPRDILVEEQLQNSLAISWSAPEDYLLHIGRYDVCVDGLVKLFVLVPGGYKHTRLLENLDLSRPRHVSVRAVTEKGHSLDASCTVTVLLGASVAPQNVRTCHITPFSVQLSWYPSNSNYEHIILLNGIKVGACPSSFHQVLLKGLSPSTMYTASVRTNDPRPVLKPVEGFIDFMTLPTIGLNPGPQDDTLLIRRKPVEILPNPSSRIAIVRNPLSAKRKRTHEGAISSDSNVVRPRMKIKHATGTNSKQLLTSGPIVESSQLQPFNVVRPRMKINHATATGSNSKRSLTSGPIVESSQLQPFPTQATITACATTMASKSGPTSMLSTSGGLPMVPPSSGPIVMPGALTQQTKLYSNQMPQYFPPLHMIPLVNEDDIKREDTCQTISGDQQMSSFDENPQLFRSTNLDDVASEIKTKSNNDNLEFNFEIKKEEI